MKILILMLLSSDWKRYNKRVDLSLKLVNQSINQIGMRGAMIQKNMNHYRSVSASSNRQNLRELSIFILLLAIGVAGRWTSPVWNFTPLAAVTLCGGFLFRRKLVAFLLPVSILAVSDIFLPVHDNLPVMISVHAMMVIPLLLGRWVRGKDGLQQAFAWGLCGLLPATAFFLTTNMAVWIFKSSYEPTLAGLAACYTAGIPFYRAMLAGDIFYLGVMLTCLAVARVTIPKPQPVPVKS